MISNLLDRIKGSVLTKIVFIGFLVLVMLIPLSMVESLIKERKARRDKAIREVSLKWGKSQLINGPIIVVPFRDHYMGNDKKWYVRIMHAYFLPEKLNIAGSLNAQIRKRGIFDVPLYNLDLKIAASFRNLNFSQFKVSKKDILWNEAFVTVGIPDTRGIKDQATLKVLGSNGEKIKSIKFAPGPKDTRIFVSGIHAVFNDFQKIRSKKFSLDFNLTFRT